MLAIRPPATSSSQSSKITKPLSKKVSPNVLPCRINHNGYVSTSKRYWDPRIETSSTVQAKDNENNVKMEDKKIAYFRGRKLYGKTITIPPNYVGSILLSTDNILTAPQKRTGETDTAMGLNVENTTHNSEEEEGEEEKEEETKILEEQANFEELVVWGHEMIVDGVGGGDPYVRGVEEWIQWAGVVNAED